MDYDVVVVGARCAGSPAAMLLARAGYRVLLLDRARFPRDTLCTHHLLRPGMQLLDKWGLLDRLLASGLPAMRTAVFDVVGRVRLTGPVPATERLAGVYAPRRVVLDQLLVDAAVEAGAEFRDGHTVTDVRADENIVEFRTASGERGRVSARLVIGADGMRSNVAEFVGARTEVEDEKLSCVYFAYWEGVPVGCETYQKDGTFIGVDQTHDGLAVVVTYFRQTELFRIRRDPWAAYMAAIQTTAPELADRLSRGKLVGKLRATSSQRNFFRQATGPGWVLLGDAGCTKDSILGTGITDAFKQAERLAELIGDGLRDQDKLAAALRDFADQRHALLDESYYAALQSARLQVDDGLIGYAEHVRSDPDATAQFLAVAVGAQ